MILKTVNISLPVTPKKTLILFEKTNVEIPSETSFPESGSTCNIKTLPIER